MAEDLPVLVSRAVKGSLKKLQEENSVLKESNLMIRAEAEKLTCNLLMTELEHSRLEDAMDAELRSTRKEASDLRQKLHLQLQEKIDLESKLVPYRLKVADLEAAKKAEASRVENLEKRSTDREILLGKVEKERDNALVEAREEAKKIAAELAHARDEGKKTAEELTRAREETEELKKQTHELEQSAAQVLTAGFDAALEQVACQYPDFDLSMVSISNEVVDGKIVPSED
ncbi:myosin-7-like [Phaseolus vulgaris]|uniref:myosin-7-like n=1 Tax=Phaseolus vulgaris TaxID=3885 RepID=UPI0035CAC8BA